MKIKVTKEGREGVYIVDKKEITNYLENSGFEMIHNFPQPKGMMFIGADHSLESVIQDINKAERIAIMTGSAKANNMDHALAVIIDNKLEMFDIGDITEKDLIIK